MKRGRFAFVFASSVLLLVLAARESHAQTEADFSGIWFLSQSTGQPELFVPNSSWSPQPQSPFTPAPRSIVITQTAEKIAILRTLSWGREESVYDRNNEGHFLEGRFGAGVDELSQHHQASRVSLSGSVLTVATDYSPAHPSIGRTKEVYTLAGRILTLLEVHDLAGGHMMRTIVYSKQ